MHASKTETKVTTYLMMEQIFLDDASLSGLTCLSLLNSVDVVVSLRVMRGRDLFDYGLSRGVALAI